MATTGSAFYGLGTVVCRVLRTLGSRPAFPLSFKGENDKAEAKGKLREIIR